jgi:hypothetical protein
MLLKIVSRISDTIQKLKFKKVRRNVNCKGANV